MTDTMTSQNIDLSSWDTLYKQQVVLTVIGIWFIESEVSAVCKFYACNMRNNIDLAHQVICIS
jgi:hypothetical protein